MNIKYSIPVLILVLVYLVANQMPTSAPEQLQGQPTQFIGNEVQIEALNLMMQQLGKGYVLGTQGPDTFDCSGLIYWAYGQLGYDIPRTTFTQLDGLGAVTEDRLEDGDLMYFQGPGDQHVGVLFHDADGSWSLLNAHSPGEGVIISPNVMTDPYWSEGPMYVIGYRRV